MLIKEFFNANNGIFTSVFHKEHEDLYATIFNTIEPSVLDEWVQLKYGNRIMLPNITVNNYTYILNSIIYINAASWTKVINLLNKEYDIFKPITKETTSTNKATTTTTGANTNLNALKAFNDTDFTDSERAQINTEGTSENTHASNLTEAGIGTHTYSFIVQQEIALRKEEFRKTIINDIIQEITLFIYN